MKKFKSVAVWEGTNPTSDWHDTEEQAIAVCRMLERDGYGGEGKMFPMRTYVEPKWKEGDKVKLKYIPNDLRYDVKLGDVGTIESFLDPNRGEYSVAVKWFKNESAMTHKPDELELLEIT